MHLQHDSEGLIIYLFIKQKYIFESTGLSGNCESIWLKSYRWTGPKTGCETVFKMHF